MIPLYLDPDAPAAIHGLTADEMDGRSPIRNPIVFTSTPSITLNDPTDDVNDTYAVEDVSIGPAWDEVAEPNSDRDGSNVGEPREVQKILTLRGWVRAPTYAKLYDKIAKINRAFNPVNAYIDDVDQSDYDIGFLPLQFKVPTADTANWAAGYISQQYYVRSIGLPVPIQTKYDDLQARFHIVLRLADPRRYEQTQQSANRTGPGNITVDNSLATYHSWPIIEIAFTTVPGVNFNISRTTQPTLDRFIYLLGSDLSDAAGKTLIIDSQYRTAEYSDGTDKTNAIMSHARFWYILAGESQTIAASANTPADAVVTIKWRRAFA